MNYLIDTPLDIHGGQSTPTAIYLDIPLQLHGVAKGRPLNNKVLSLKIIVKAEM
jgi:hypothetical protein